MHRSILGRTKTRTARCGVGAIGLLGRQQPSLPQPQHQSFAATAAAAAAAPSTITTVATANTNPTAAVRTNRTLGEGISQIQHQRGQQQRQQKQQRNLRYFAASTSSRIREDSNGNNNNRNDDGPSGDLFDERIGDGSSPMELIGRAGRIRRFFGPRSGADALLACGGERLAAHASFDPDYGRARSWIRQHAVGPAVLSPVLVVGLTQALVEAAFPESVPDTQSMKQLRPLIVNVEVEAAIEVIDVVMEESKNEKNGNPHNDERGNGGSGGDRSPANKYGYRVRMKTTVTGVRDHHVIAEGTHTVWIPDYLHM